jgi:hypothetical protein
MNFVSIRSFGSILLNVFVGLHGKQLNVSVLLVFYSIGYKGKAI